MADTELPSRWTYGVRADGRVFFVSDSTRTTTWIHPRTGLPVNSGHMIRSDLPRGWEEGFTPDGASYFIDHNERRTTFTHPQTGLTSSENSAFILRDLAPQSRAMSKPELSSGGDSTVPLSSKTIRGSKVHSFGKRQLSVKRNPNVAVERRGWIYKQDSSGMRLWKRKWFVLSDYCLFYYKDSREQSVLGSIPLPSYEVSPVAAQDHVGRKFAFKAQHSGMRTYFFSAETQDDMNAWITAMNRASRVQDQSRDQARVQTADLNPTMVQNGLGKVHNGVNCGTNTTDRPSDLLDSTRSSEQTLVHEVQLEPPLHRVQSPDLVAAATPRLTPPSQDPAPSQSRFNGPDSIPSPILEPNGIAAGTYQTSPLTSTPPGSVYRQATPTGSAYKLATPTPRQATPPNSSLSRDSVRDQVQTWVKVQKEEQRRSASRNSLHRTTPPAQFSPIEPPHPHTAPTGRAGEYRYAQDRLSHFGLSDPTAAPPSFWRLYEWQQRHQYRHGNPTAPLYSPAPLRPFGSRPLTSAERPRAATPRCIEVPPSATEVPPSLPSAPIGRRPHTPAERLTVRPTNESATGGGAFSGSPRRSQSQFFKVSTLDRRSLPVSGHMTHTFSAPSLHGKTLEDSYLQLQREVDYLDLRAGGAATPKESRPVRAAESDIDVKLSRLCEQDKCLKELESRISSLSEEKEQVETVLALSHQQMEQFSDSAALQKISLHQKLLQEDLVQLRAQLSRASTDMCRSWEQFVLLEKNVEQLRSGLQRQLELSSNTESERAELKRELWRIEDVLSGLSSSRTRYSSTVKNLSKPERTLVPSTTATTTTTSPPTTPLWPEDPAPPRPPLPCGFDEDDDSAPEVPPLPREAAVIRHMSVRGLKRQSDERRRDREGGDWKTDLRSFLSEPELPVNSCSQLDPPPTGVSGSSSGLTQSSVSAFVTLRRGTTDRERPKSSVESSAFSSTLDSDWLSSGQARGRMSADEQLQRLRRHRERQPCTRPEQVCARGAPPPTPKRSSSRERRRQILQLRQSPDTQPD